MFTNLKKIKFPSDYCFTAPSIMALPRHVLDGMQELLRKEPEKLVNTVQSCLGFLAEHGMVTTMKLPPLAVGE